ncbi:hypothetical protein HDU97_005051 [Phlyctochytrium planicorne]|nr:hypothetical protein HDU97_005051 [Phlyctochytrium planicorne]
MKRRATSIRDAMRSVSMASLLMVSMFFNAVNAATTVKFLGIPMLGNLTLEMMAYKNVIDLAKQNHDIDLIIELVPTLSTTDYAGLLGSLIKVNSSDYDILQIDVVWPGQWADAFMDINPYISESVKAQHIPNILNANNINGRQVAAPFFADYGLLYYRSDLLEKYNFSGPPQTWDEMQNMMSVIVPAEKKTNPSFYGYIGQYNAYEGLTCDFLEWVYSVGGGTIIEPNKTVSVNSPIVKNVVKQIKSWLYPPYQFTPLTGLVFDETASYQMWLKGNALFMRNWPFVISITKGTATFPKNKNGTAAFGTTRLPGGKKGQTASTLGGWQLAINKFSKNPSAAAKAVELLISRDAQMERYRYIGLMPTISALYTDPEFCTLNPQCGMFGSFDVAARPASGTSPFYLAASEQIYLWANKILRDDITVDDGLSQMTVGIQKAIRTYVEPTIDLGPPIFVDYTEGLGLAFEVIAGVMAFIALALFIIIIIYRKHKLLTSSSPIFMLIMVLGTLVAHGAIYAYTGEPTKASCIVQPWLVVMSFSITVSALITKNWRIYRIFRNKFQVKMNMKDEELVKACFALIGVNIVLMIVWTVVDPPQKALIPLPTSQFYSCRSNNQAFGWGMIGGLLFYNMLLLLVGVFLAYSTRNVKGPFNESQYIGYTIYTMVLLNIILLPLSYVESMGAKFQYIFRAIAIEGSAAAVTINMFVPKIAMLFREKDNNVASDVLGTASNTRGSISSNSESQTKKIVKCAVMEVMDGSVCVRYGKTKLAMNMMAWRDMQLNITPSSRLIVMYPTVNSKDTNAGPVEMGVSFQLRSIVVEDIPNADGVFMFNCTLNGMFYQVQVGSAEMKAHWIRTLNDLTTNGNAVSSATKQTTTKIPVKYLGIPMLSNTTTEMKLYQKIIDQAKANFDVDLIVEILPTQSATEYAGLLSSLLKVNSSDNLLFMVDVVWSGQWAQSFLDINPFVNESLKAEHIPNIYNSNNVQGRQVATPLFADYGLLFYRTDLLEKYNYSAPPQTWDEMENMMAVIVPNERKTNPAFYGYVGQYNGNTYEGLTCNFLERVFSVGGGTVIEPNKTVSVNSPAVNSVVSRIKSWMYPPKTYTPATALVYEEGSSLKGWLQGNALFVRNWPFVDALTKSTAGFPQKNGTAAIGMSRDAQMGRFKYLGLMPTITSLYNDAEFCKLNPNCGLFGSFQVAARPASGTSPYYLAASEQIYLWANKILRDDISVSDGLAQMTVGIQKAIKTYVEPTIDLGPPIFVNYNDPLGLAFEIIAGVMAALALALFVIIIIYRKHKLLTSSSPIFMLIMVVGTLVAHGAIYAYTGEPSKTSCILQPWLVVMAFSITVAALVTKNWRIYRIFRNKFMVKMNMKDEELAKTCAALIGVNIVLMIVWTAVDPPQKALILLPTSQFYSCKSNNSTFGWGIIGGLLAYNVLLLAAGVFLAYSTRNVKGPFNESQYIGYTIYTMVLLNIILLPLSYVESMGAKFQYIFRAIAIEGSAAAVTINMFVPQIAALFRDKDNNVESDLRRGSNAPTASVTSTESQGKKAAVKSAVMEVMDGSVCIRFGKTKLAMNMMSWRDMHLTIVPSTKLIVFYPSVSKDEVSTTAIEKNNAPKTPAASEMGISFQARKVIIEDIPSSDGIFMFGANLNGLFYQIQIGNAEMKDHWIKAFNELTTASGNTVVSAIKTR